MKTRQRPKQIHFEASDPFDDTPLMSATLTYEPRKAADGFYTNYVKRMAWMAKHVWPDVLQMREPTVTATPIY